jgi:protein-S-isoprenylcysteine O-methyltransferase Ste14
VHTLRVAIDVAWVVFWIYWFAVGTRAKHGSFGRRRIPLNGVTAIAVVVLVRVFRGGSLEVHSPVLGAIGAALFISGLSLAIWARVHLGENWGMPMSEKDEPELVTSGPYSAVRHPIYSGLLLAFLGTALVTNLIGLAITAVLVAYFYYCGTVEERNLTATFPTAYPQYMQHTKMLIPFLL